MLAHLHRYLHTYDPSHARPASRYAHRAIEVRDHADDAYVTLGTLHAKQGRPTRAFAAFQQALAVRSHNTAALLGAARFRADRGEIDEEPCAGSWQLTECFVVLTIEVDGSLS